MSRIPHTLAVLALIALIASPLSAADEKKKKKPAGKQRDAISAMLAKVDLSEDQQKKVDELKKKFGEKLSAARKGVAGLITAEQRQARAEAMKQAKADGKKGKELQEAVNAAVSLTDEQKEAMKKAQTESREVMAAVRTELKKILTDEQVKTLGLNRGQKQAKGEKKPGEKKPGEKKKKATEAA